MKTISIEEVAREATQAALAVIDAATDGTSRKGRSPAGDALAFAMDALIQQQLTAHFADDNYAPAPAWTRTKELEQLRDEDREDAMAVAGNLRYAK